MATPGDYLVVRTVEDANVLLADLEQAKRLVTRIVQRMEALGVAALNGYQWPNGYTQTDFVNLYNALAALPGSVVADETRNKIFKLVAAIQ